MVEKIKVLQINASTEYAGVSSMLFNIYKNIDREKFHFDFLSPNKTSFELKRAEIEKLGGKIYGLNVNDKNKVVKFLRLYLRLKRFLRNNTYDIIHINSGSRVYNAIVSFCCKRNTNAKIIVHSHNGKNSNALKDRIAKRAIEKNTDAKFSCSDIASRAMFEKTNDVVLIKNGIDAKAFRFNREERDKVRAEFGVKKDERLIGNIGRMTAQKNQEFLINVFSEVVKEMPKSKLLIIGSGELEGDIRQRINDLNIADNVIIASNRNDMPAIYSALDVFVLPSLYEGLPVSAIEAQYNGLPTILSDRITEECRISDQVKFASIKIVNAWKLAIFDAKRPSRMSISNSFDIRKTASFVCDRYLELLRG